MIKTADTAELKAREYVFDLHNISREFGFKDGETWEIVLATDEERPAFMKKYYPVIMVKALPVVLSEMLRLVKAKLKQNADGERQADSQVIKRQFEYIIAFNPTRLRG